MKHKYQILLLALVVCFLACNYEEDSLQSSGENYIVRFKFPQGENDWDYEIKKIYDQYGVYLIYKDVSEQDLNRRWTSVGTGKLYTGKDLSDGQVPFYLSFLQKNLFQYIIPAIAKTVLPMKIYLLDNFRSYNPGEDPDKGTGGTGTGGTGTGGTGTGGTGTGGTGTGGTGTGRTGTGGTGTGGTQDPNFVALKTDGFDYWALSFTESQIENLTEDEKRVRRAVLVYLIIEKAMKNGVIEEPKNFGEKMDYKKRIYTTMDVEMGTVTSDDPDYYLNRGFINIIPNNFDRNNERPPYDIMDYTDVEVDPRTYPHRDFLYFVRAAIFYPEHDFRAHYPKDLFPLINERYDIVYNYLKTTYTIDVKQIALGSDEL